MLTFSTSFKYCVIHVVTMSQVDVSDKVKTVLTTIKDSDGHTSMDSVIRTLLIGSGYDINGVKE